MQVDFDFAKDQMFIEKSNPQTVWSLLDVVEAVSLLHPENGKQVVVHLVDKKSRKIKRILYVYFESNFIPVQNSMLDKINELERLFQLPLQDE